MEPMDKEEEQLQLQMAETRASLSEKLETLEQKVVGTVEEATTAVNQTVDVIKESVQGTVTAVNETVKESVETVKESMETVKDWFDVSGHVREHPWAMVGGSVAVGYCLGTILGKTQQIPVSIPVPYAPYRTESYSNGGSREERPRPPETPSAVQSALSTWKPEIDKLKGLALGVLFGTVREMITSSVSQHVGEQLKDVFDSATRKVGGEPIPSSDFAKMHQDETAGAWQGQRERETAESGSGRW